MRKINYTLLLLTLSLLHLSLTLSSYTDNPSPEEQEEEEYEKFEKLENNLPLKIIISVINILGTLYDILLIINLGVRKRFRILSNKLNLQLIVTSILQNVSYLIFPKEQKNNKPTEACKVQNALYNSGFIIFFFTLLLITIHTLNSLKQNCFKKYESKFLFISSILFWTIIIVYFIYCVFTDRVEVDMIKFIYCRMNDYEDWNYILYIFAGVNGIMDIACFSINIYLLKCVKNLMINEGVKKNIYLLVIPEIVCFLLIIPCKFGKYYLVGGTFKQILKIICLFIEIFTNISLVFFLNYHDNLFQEFKELFSKEGRASINECVMPNDDEEPMRISKGESSGNRETEITNEMSCRNSEM